MTAKTIGTAYIVAAAAACSGCATDTVTTVVEQRPSTIELSATTLSLPVGSTQQISATVKDAAGVSIAGALPLWTAQPAGIVSVSTTGLVSALSAGTATVVATFQGKSSQAAVQVSDTTVAPPPVQPPPVSPPPPAGAAAFIIGPQVPLGQSPWPFFDSNMAAKAATYAATYLSSRKEEDHYYDLGLALYILAHRSGDPAHLKLAQDVSSAWWNGMATMATWDKTAGGVYDVAPRVSALGGLMLYALDGHGDDTVVMEGSPRRLWDWLTGYVRYHYDMWLGRRLTGGSLYYGVRDGGYMLLYTAYLAQIHPDTAVRAEMKTKALKAARDYYARLQYPNGGWFWKDSNVCGGTCFEEEPFMVGLLLEGMIATHQLTADPAVGAAIVKSVDHIWATYDASTVVPSKPAVRWRASPYFVFADGTVSKFGDLAGGWDTNTIREHRQRNSLVVHAFGYAYQLTKDAKYRDEGDELFASSYGKGQGPLADAYYGLGDFRGKEFDQAYRSAGRYLAWRN